MRSSLGVFYCGFFFVFICLSFVQCKIVYQCDFDNATLEEHCFTTKVLIFSGFLFLNELPPNSPSSDVTSSLKPTKNGEVCQLPYRIGHYMWDMYFCNNNVCPTNTSANSTCASGQFAAVELVSTETRSFQLKTESGGIDGIDEQYLTYYYYMSNMGGKRIQVRKEEVDGAIEIVDSVTSSPFNGWIKHEVKFNAKKSGYKLYFDVQRTVSEPSFIEVGLDEISIWQEDEATTAMTSTPMESTTDTSAMQTTEFITTTLVTTSFEISTASSTVTTDQSTTVTSVIHTSTAMLTSATTSNAITSLSTNITTLTSYSTSMVSTRETTTLRTATPTTDHIDSTSSQTSSHTIEGSLPTPKSTAGTSTTVIRTSIETTTIFDDKNVAKPFSKAYIIILSTVVPLVLILSVGIIIKLKRPSTKIRSLSMDGKDSRSTTDPVELELINNDRLF